MKVQDYIQGWKITHQIQTKDNKETMKELRKILKSGLTYKQLTNQYQFIYEMKEIIKKREGSE